MFKKINNSWIVSILLLIYICVQSYCIQQLSINYDEGLFAYYGTTILKFNGNKDIVLFDSKLPITALNMLPRAFTQLAHPNLKRPNANVDIIMGRYVSLCVSILLALVIYRWSSLLYGQNAGLFSLTIFLLCPNFLAHGIFVSSDIYACLFMTSSLYLLWEFCRSDKVIFFVLASFAVALAEISKFSMLHLFILFPILLATRFFIINGLVVRWRKLLKLFLIFVFINWFVICSAHLFYGMFIPLNNYHFRSDVLQHIQLFFHRVGGWLYIPFPSSYIESLDIVMHLDHLGGGRPGSTIGPFYMLGKSSQDGFWYYYFVAFLFKLPIATIITIGAALMLFLRKRADISFAQHELFLLIPALYFLIYLDFFYSTQIGIRHILIIVPLLYVFAGFLYQQIGSLKYKYFIYGLTAYQFISVAIYFPHFLPYTNELLINKKNVYRKIADTNLCYGEGQKYLLEYLKKHPDAKYLPEQITSGRIVMEVNEMLDINITTIGKYDWIRPLQPVDHIHSQYLIFDVSTSTADSLRKLQF